jgi:hypothetical protein
VVQFRESLRQLGYVEGQSISIESRFAGDGTDLAQVVADLIHVKVDAIVIDGWISVSVAGIDLIGVETRVVVASLATYAKRAKAVDRALGRGRRPGRAATPSPAISEPARPAAQLAPTNIAGQSARTCPLCQKHGRRQDVVLVTVGTNTETRVTARCSICDWQRTYAE